METKSTLETTWEINSGFLENSVTFESSDDSLVESDSPRKFTPPLILKPPAPDSGPCEIELYFSQKYNIRQIYVRSTARVYEVYYAKSQRDGNEYLCTVRCGIAERDGQVLQTGNAEEFSEESTKHAAIESNEEKFTDEEKSAPSEEDWVEVKVLDSPPPLENGVGSLSNKTNSNIQRSVQDYYEATVETNDPDPCSSLTIRLLSVQNKGCVFIDEVYVFAELVGSVDSENQPPPVNSSAGSSLMAMFVPALLQLSKSGINPIQGQQASEKLGKGNKVEPLSSLTDLTDVPADIHQGENFSADQQCVKLQDLDGSIAESVKPEVPNQNLKGDRSHDAVVETDSTYGHIEKVLEQLVSRVSKIEEVCLRFEENMLKPICSMEMRIKQVEQQLESLAKNSHYSGLPPGTRISAPSFSCESNSSSFHNDASDCQPSRGPELERREFTSGPSANPSDDMSNSVNAPSLLPSLVVTAPEFSCGDDEQDDDILESFDENNRDDEVSKSSKDSPRGKLKRIDGILAAALSNFLSSSSDYPAECEQIISNEVPAENVQVLPSKPYEVITNVIANEEARKYTQILTVTAPEFTSEGNDSEDDSDYAQFPSTEVSKFASKKSEEKDEVPLCGGENGFSPVISDSCDCIEYKSARDPLRISTTIARAGCANPSSIIPDDTRSGAAHVQEQSLQESTTGSSLTADQAKGSVKTDVCETRRDTGQGLPSLILSPKKKNANSLGPDVQNQFLKGITCSFLDRNISYTAEQAKNSVRIDVCQTTEDTGERESSIYLQPENEDVLELNFGYNTATSLNGARTAAGGVQCIAAERPDNDIPRNVSESSSVPLVDFGLPILDVKFASHENSSTQPSLEALFSDLPEQNFEANSLGKSGDFDSAKGTNFIEMDDGVAIDPLTSKRLLVDLGIYDIVVSSDEESGLDDPCTTCNQEFVASLI